MTSEPERLLDSADNWPVGEPYTPPAPTPPPPFDDDPPGEFDSLPSDMERRYHERLAELENKIRPLEQQLYETHPRLLDVRSAALQNMAYPIATIFATLGRIMMTVSPNVYLYTGISRVRPAPLNPFVLLCGMPGDGKDLACDVAEVLVPLPTDRSVFYEMEPASGQALASALFYTQTDENDEPVGVKQRDAVLIRINEGETWIKKASNSTSTLWGDLRKMYSGQRIGDDRADAKNNRIVDALSYRAGGLISLQPAIAGPLLRENAGMLQRWAFTPSIGSDITVQAADALDDYVVTPLTPPLMPRQGVLVMPEKARRDMRQQREDNANHLLAFNATHSAQSRARFSVPLAMLEGRTEPADVDYDASGVLLQISTLTQEWLLDAQQILEMKNNEQTGTQQGNTRAYANFAQAEKSLELNYQRTEKLRRVKKSPRHSRRKQ